MQLRIEILFQNLKRVSTSSDDVFSIVGNKSFTVESFSNGHIYNK